MNEYLTLLQQIEDCEAILVTDPENIFDHLKTLKELETKLENIIRSGFF